jgi:tripartite-type tricarboxylate transporter receptor subunit TctC
VLDAILTVTGDILRSPALQQKLDAHGLNIRIETPDVFGERIRRETATWRELIRERNITAN